MESALAFSPLYTAVRRNQLDSVRLLLAAGADPKQGESTGEDPLFTACGMGFADCVQLLLEAGANPNSISPGPGGTPMMLTAQTSHINAPRILKLLIEHGANVHHLNSVERNGLHAAADSLADVIECSQILIDAGVDVNKEDMFGQTPMHMAAIANRPRIIKLFVEYGGRADVKSKEGSTPLDVAIKMENKESIEMLKALGDVKGLKQSPEVTSGACVAKDNLLVDISDKVAGKGQDDKGQDSGAIAAEQEDETLIDLSNAQPANPEPTDSQNNHTTEKWSPNTENWKWLEVTAINVLIFCFVYVKGFCHTFGTMDFVEIFVFMLHKEYKR